jgi:hypothetical protein
MYKEARQLFLEPEVTDPEKIEVSFAGSWRVLLDSLPFHFCVSTQFSECCANVRQDLPRKCLILDSVHSKLFNPSSGGFVCCC